MNIFTKKDKRKEKDIITKEENEIVPFEEAINESNGIIEVGNNMLAEVREHDTALKSSTMKFALSTITKISPSVVTITEEIKKYANNNPNFSGRIFRITNMGSNGELRKGKKGQFYWPSIKKKGQKPELAHLKEVPGFLADVDPYVLLVTAALAGIETELNEIKEITNQILSFLQHEKTSEIEADVEILTKSIDDLKYNYKDENYRSNKLNQILNIERTAKKNMIFYKKEIKDDLEKNKLITTNISMKALLKDILNEFKYYRLSLYLYSFSNLIEVMLINDVKSDYILLKRDELDKLDKEYSEDFNRALEYVKHSANKSLEGNLLKGLGTAGRAAGGLAELVKLKKANKWMSEKGDNIQKFGEVFEEGFVDEFNKMKDSNSKIFVHRIEQVDLIYNKTKEISFDKEFMYLEF